MFYIMSFKSMVSSAMLIQMCEIFIVSYVISSVEQIIIFKPGYWRFNFTQFSRF